MTYPRRMHAVCISMMWALGYLLGTLGAHELDDRVFRSSFWLSMFIYSLFFVSLWIFFLWKRKWKTELHQSTWSLSFLAFFLGLGWTWFDLKSIEPIDTSLESRPLDIQVRIIHIVSHNDHHTRFFAVDLKSRKKMQLSYYVALPKARFSSHESCRFDSHARANSQPLFQVDQVWALRVRLKKPHGLKNPGLFRKDLWLKGHRIEAQGSVQDAQLLRKTKSIRGLYIQWVDRIIFGYPHASLMMALTSGIKSDFREEDWTIFQHTGTNHLWAIAGLHVGFIYALCRSCLVYFWRRFPKLCLAIPAPRVGMLGGCAMSLGYVYLSGLDIPAQRAILMMIFGMLHTNTKPIAWAMVGILWVNPCAVLLETFWLSFVCVGIILLAQAKQHRTMLWITTLGLFPISAYYFHQFSVTGFVANAFSIPWVGWITLPLILASLITYCLSQPMSEILMIMAHNSVHALWIALEYVSKWPVIPLHIQNIGILWISTLGVICILTPSLSKISAAVMLLPVFWKPTPKSITWGRAQLEVMDVGQGLSCIVRTQNHLLIYDTGDQYLNGGSVAQRVLIPFLSAQSVRSIDMLIVSHQDRDHSGGVADLLKQYSVRSFLTSAPWKWPQSRSCMAGQHWNWDGVEFKILNPPANPEDLHAKTNNQSCVLYVEDAHHHAFLLTGDIEKYAEARIDIPSHAQLDAITIPHHGSRTSSSEKWLSRLKPQWGICSAGYRNAYRLPNPLVVERYWKNDIKFRNTAVHGYVCCQSGGTCKHFAKNIRISDP